MAASSEDIQMMLEGNIPEEAQEVSDEQGRKVIRREGEFYKVVSEQDLDTLGDIYDKLGGSGYTPKPVSKSILNQNKFSQIRKLLNIVCRKQSVTMDLIMWLTK